MFAGAPVALDPFAMSEPYGHVSFIDTTGKTSESAALLGGEKTLILLDIGNSIRGNDRPSAFNPTTNAAKCQQMNPHSGTVYRAAGALLGANGSGGNGAVQLADKIITSANNPVARAIIYPSGRSGTPASYWTYRGGLDHHVRVLMRRMLQAGHLVASEDVLRCGFINIGQTDATDGVSAANYQAYVREIVATCTQMGFAGAKWFVNKTTMNSNVVNATIQGAQTGLVDNVTFFAAADVDALTGGTNRRGDGTHLTDTGYGNMTDAELAAFDAQF